nr:MAG TPA: Putative TM nitroreductase [Caudoviricetes sp.]
MFLEAGILTRRSVRQFQPDKEIPHNIKKIRGGYNVFGSRDFNSPIS